MKKWKISIKQAKGKGSGKIERKEEKWEKKNKE